MKKVIILISLILSSFFANSQISKQDSLLNLFNKIKEDTSKAKLLIELGNYYNDIYSDSAIICFNQAIVLSKKITKSKNEKIKETGSYLYVLCMYKIGFAESLKMNYNESEKYFNKALEYCGHLYKYSESNIVKFSVNELKANIYNGIGNIYVDKGYYSIALNNYLKAQKIRDILISAGKMSESETAGQYYSIGLVHYYLKNYSKSLDYYEKCLNICQEFNNLEGIAKCNLNIGIIEAERNNVDIALKHYNKTLDFALENKNPILEAHVYTNLSECYIEKKEYSKAELYLAKAMIIAQKHKNKQGEIFIMLGLSDLYNILHKYDKSLDFCLRAVDISKEIGLLSLEKNAYKQSSTVYENKGNFIKALHYHKKFKKFEDSIFNKEKNKQIEDAEAKYQSTKKQIEIDQQKLELAKRDAQIKKKRNQNFAFTIAVFLLITIIIFIYLSLKQKQKTSKFIKSQNKKITDSIEYAKKIQTAALPSEKYLEEIFESHFVIYKPLQIVSGDFYWAIKKDHYSVFAAADCTGHGVPGAFVSMLGISLLNELSLNSDITGPDKILEEMRFILKRSFSQTGELEEQKDGIDISLCVIDNNSDTLYFSGANNTGYLMRNGNIIELEPVMNPIGIYPKEIPFKKQEIKLQKNDIIYLFSDGYADQFGGQNNKPVKYTIAAFKKLLIKNYKKPLKEQKEILEKQFIDWQNNHIQIDDVLVFAVKY
ncbi:MAG: tetratricopeptide repeat protein [Bacteroidales bacterium]|nr:tetratricopeptide repeat protein [Bacteroidales bacterium]